MHMREEKWRFCHVSTLLINTNIKNKTPRISRLYPFRKSVPKVEIRAGKIQISVLSPSPLDHRKTLHNKVTLCGELCNQALAKLLWWRSWLPCSTAKAGYCAALLSLACCHISPSHSSPLSRHFQMSRTVRKGRILPLLTDLSTFLSWDKSKDFKLCTKAFFSQSIQKRSL